MKRFLFLAPLALALSVSAASVKISDLALVSTPSTNTFQEIADLNASGTNKSARVFLAWTSVGGSLQPLLPATNYFLGADIFASSTNLGQNVLATGNRSGYNAYIDALSHDIRLSGNYAGRGMTSIVSAFITADGDNTLAVSYLTNSQNIYARNNYALQGLHTTNSSNIMGDGHSAGQGVVATGSGNLFFDGNESGLSTYFTNSFDISAFNGAFKSAGFTNSQNIVGLLINAGSSNMFNGSSNLLVVGSGATVPNGAKNGMFLGPGMNLVIGTDIPTTGLTDTLLVMETHETNRASGPLWVQTYDTITEATSFITPIASFDSRRVGSPPTNNFGGSTTLHVNNNHVGVDGSFSSVLGGGNGIYAIDATVTSFDVTPAQGGAATAVQAYSDTKQTFQNGLSAIAIQETSDQTSIAGSGVVLGVFGTGPSVGLYGVLRDRGTMTDSAVFNTSAILAENFDTGLPLFTGTTANGSVVFQVPGDGSIAAGTTNRWQTGSDAPGASGLTLVTTNYISITVNGVAYKLALVQ